MTTKIGAGSGADALVCEPTSWSGPPRPLLTPMLESQRQGDRLS
jgi:hypothetical protein